MRSGVGRPDHWHHRPGPSPAEPGETFPYLDHDERQILDAAASAGLTLVDQRPAAPTEAAQSPAEVADSIEAKTWSSLWNLTDEQWRAVVAPTVAALRALPTPTSNADSTIPSRSSCCNDDSCRRLRRLANKARVALDGPHPSPEVEPPP